MKDKVICLMVVGKKYQRQYEEYKQNFTDYAKRCDADLVIINEPIDKSFHRPLLSQKMLIPAQLQTYATAAFLDLDILISDKAPSIFDFLPNNKSFGAVLDLRNTEKFNKTWAHIPRILRETTTDYFSERGFESSGRLLGSINGGVFVFRPKEVVEIFSDYYFSDHNQGELNSFEETPMAYFTQMNDMFHALDERFNVQVLYELKGTVSGEKVIADEQKIPNIIRKWYYKKSGFLLYPTKKYKNFVKTLSQNNFFVHFAGNYPIIRLEK